MKPCVSQQGGCTRRNRRDGWDEEYDRGKQKKVKGAHGRDQ